MADTLSTLQKIRIKIRRLTKSPSVSQITNDEVDSYINSFVLYDFPSSLKLNALKTTFTFYTTPHQDQYENNTADADDQFYNFINEYQNVLNPVFLAGRNITLYKSKDEFYSDCYSIEYSEDIGTGDGARIAWAGNLGKKPVLKNKVLFRSVDGDGNNILAIDNGNGILQSKDGTNIGTINYVTGAYLFDFANTPANGETISASYVPYKASMPTRILYNENKFKLWPVPDKAYRVEVTTFKRPSELLNADQSPQLSQWWEYIALGASRKLLLDRMDIEGLQKIEPEFNRQEVLINRRTIENQLDQRTSTIYRVDDDYYNYHDYFWLYRG